MAFSRSLLLKGLAGAAAVAGGGVGIAYREDIGNLFKSNKKVNDKLGSLGLEGDCLLKDDEDSTAFSKECPLDLERLKKIKFSNRGEGELTVKGEVPQELKLKIEGTKEDITFSFRGITDSSPISIFGDKSKGKIVLKGEEQKFKDVDGRLTKSASVDETLMGFNGQLEKINAPLECRFDEAETDTSAECPVTSDDLRGIKFSGLGEGDLTIGGEVSSGLKLKVKRDQENAMTLSFTELGENLTIYADQKSGGIVIKSGKKFRVGEDGKLKKVSIVVTPDLKVKLGEFNKQLEKVKAPLQCRFDEEEGDESVECPVTHDQLKTMEFSNKKGIQDLRIVGSVQPGLKLRVERDSKNEMFLFFTGLEQNLTIYGDQNKGKMVLKSSSETKFKVGEDGKLEKESISSDPTLKDKLKKFNKQLGTINVPTDCRFDDAEAEESIECPITKDQFELLEFSNKENSNIKVFGWPTDLRTIRLKAEKDSNNEMSLFFSGLSQDLTIYENIRRGKIVIKNEGQKFSVINNKLTKGTPDADLKKFNDQLGEVNAPLECRFDEAEREESLECDVTSDHLTTMALSEDEWEGLTLSENDLNGMKLKVQIVKTFDSNKNEVNDLSLTFKDYNKTVKVMKGSEEIVSFVKNTNPEFGIYGNILVKEWDDPEDFEDLFDLSCNGSGEKNKWECTFTKDSKEINIGKGSGDNFEKLTIKNISGKNFELYKGEEDYNQGYKFVFRGARVPEQGDSGVGLEPDSSYEFRWKIQEGKPREYYLAKKERS